MVYTVPTRGIGKPDYSREISLGRMRPGMTLKYLQSLSVFGITFSDVWSPYPFIAAPLAIGGSANLIDWSTGLDLPYTVAQGHVFQSVQIGCAMNQDFDVETYFDTFFTGYLVTSVSGLPRIWSDVAPFSTATFDPTGAAAHTYDLIINNLGGATMSGSISIYAIDEEVGTPPPSRTKTVRCKFCGHKWVVDKGKTLAINCPNCGELNIYLDFSHIREL